LDEEEKIDLKEEELKIISLKREKNYKINFISKIFRWFFKKENKKDSEIIEEKKLLKENII